MPGQCDQCGVEEYMPYVCKFCKARHCAAHRLPENHECNGLEAYRERARTEGRIYTGPDSVVRPSVTRGARASASLDGLRTAMASFWSLVDGKMTYIFLGLSLAMFMAQFAIGTMAPHLYGHIFPIQRDFLVQPWTIFTSIFAHGSTNHLLVNMLVLLFFGAAAEGRIGTRRFTYLWLAAGALAGIAQVLITAYFHPEDTRGALGASGALQGMMGLLVVLAPRLTVLVFFIVPAPLWAITAIYVVLDLLGTFSPGSPVAHIAHLAGLLVGIGYAFKLRRDGMPGYQPPPTRRPGW